MRHLLSLLLVIFVNTTLFAGTYPQEKVYLHFDNTSYYYGDIIHFKAYVVRADGNIASPISMPLYVDLLTQNGEIIDTKILRIDDNGQCHGDFIINRVPFYPGFYEVRAYTKYMLNFGDNNVFSRIFPIYDAPKTEGDYTQRNLNKRGTHSLVRKRAKPQKLDKPNIRFYPESGNLVKGIKSCIAFEATDQYGHPIDITGYADNDTSNLFSTEHEGKGRFTYTPDSIAGKVTINYNGKLLHYNLPSPLREGYILSVDNISSPDSLHIVVEASRNVSTDGMAIAVMRGGNLVATRALPDFRSRTALTVDKSYITGGVTQIALISKSGDIICDRLVFIDNYKCPEVTATFDKTQYEPFEKMNLSISVSDTTAIGNPFSLSIRDGNDEVLWNRNILTDLLLMSEIKGYVANPSYYFTDKSHERTRHLDLLLMVQGWRRYEIDNILTADKMPLKYMPESTGIVTSGQVISSGTGTPKPDVDISAFLLKKNEENEVNASAMDLFSTDSLGKFAFVTNVEGEWNLILAAREKGKRKDYLIKLDRNFHPASEPYLYTDMEVTTGRALKKHVEMTDSAGDENVDVVINFDSINPSKKSIEDVQQLSEVVVKGKKQSKERDIYEARSKSIAYYDVKSGLDDIRDAGEYIGDDIHKFMCEMNRNFYKILSHGEEYLHYKGRMPLFIINYQRNFGTKLQYDAYKYIRLEAIKSVYITEDPLTMIQYAAPGFDIMSIDKTYGCVVFIETYPDGEIPVDAGKGVRKTRLEGYSTPSEFYSPDYSILPPEPDYRRTLYWNPNVVTDRNGHIDIELYNNSTSTFPAVSIEGVSREGNIINCQ